MLIAYSHVPENAGGEASINSSKKKLKSTKMMTMSKTMQKILLQMDSLQIRIPMISMN